MSRQPGEGRTPDEKELLGLPPDPTPEQVADEEQRRKEKTDLRKRFLEHLMTQELFRELLMEWLVGFGTFENSFGAGPTGFPDPLATQFQLGMKAAGWFLWVAFDDNSPDLASLMRREYAKPKS